MDNGNGRKYDLEDFGKNGRDLQNADEFDMFGFTPIDEQSELERNKFTKALKDDSDDYEDYKQNYFPRNEPSYGKSDRKPNSHIKKNIIYITCAAILVIVGVLCIVLTRCSGDIFSSDYNVNSASSAYAQGETSPIFEQDANDPDYESEMFN